MPPVIGLFERLGLGFDRRWGFAVGGVSVGAFLFFLAILLQNKQPTWYFTRDPSSATQEAWYLGAASSIGLAGWIIAATLFGVAALIRHLAGGDARPFAAAMLAMGVMWFDDLFQVHEQLSEYAPEAAIIGFYALGVPALFVVIREHLSPVTRTLLFFALAGLALSVITDRFESDRDIQNVLEDGFKFLGIWMLALAALATVMAVLDEVGEADPA